MGFLKLVIINATPWTGLFISTYQWCINASDGPIINPVYADYWYFSIKFEPPTLTFPRFVYFEAQDFNLVSVNKNSDAIIHKGTTVDITLIMCVGLLGFFLNETVLSLKFNVL